ncbi:MAG: DNA translocase FtsK [Bacteroidales bacterium]|nr:DNA translocase FtsK [Bacteroidales bacterium]
MARTGKDKAAKPAKEAPARKMSEETKIKLLKVSGLVLGVFAIFTLVAVVSYFFTWHVDQSLASDPDMMGRGAEVSNFGGKLGFRWGRFLVARCFGFGSLAIVILLFAAACKLFFRKNRWSFTKTLILTLSAAIILSVILSFFSSLVSDNTMFEGGLGGDCGAFVSSWLVNVMGGIVTGLVLLICVVLWLLYASGGFTKWFLTLGDKERRPRKRKIRKQQLPVETGEEGGEVEDGDEEDVGEDEENGESGQEPGRETPATVTPAVTPAVTGPAAGPAKTGPVGPHVWKDPNGQTLEEKRQPDTPAEPIEVVDGDNINTEVKKELPRIDTREELSKYKFPSMDLLKDYFELRHEVSRQELEENNVKIRMTLQNYGIGIEKVTACKGPVVTLYKVVPAPGVRISSIRSREEDIALSLGQTGVRVVTLQDVVGIEVPNSRPSIVPLKSLFNDPAFRDNKYELPVAMGYTISQKVKVFDLTSAPHLLVAGATQQGKSVGLNVIITSLLYSKHPSEMKLVFIDPKMVEFNAYGRLLKHYLAVLPSAANEEEERQNAIVKTPKGADDVLKSLCLEMDERYKLMSMAMANKVTMYNDMYKDRKLNPEHGHRYLPYLVVVIDEYADLLMSESKQMSKNISNSIVRLAQKGRAAGIHVILATQRPTVDVVTGLIKTNFPMRIAFRTSAKIDSQTILDKPGAERLIGKGDMLFSAGVDMERMQCAMIGMDEISEITNFIGSQQGYKQCYNTPYYLPMPETDAEEGGGMVDMQNIDSLFKEAAEFVVIQQKGSTSLLQRKFGVGFARAGKIMDQLESAGVVGPQDGSKPREVLIQDLDTLKTEVFDHFLK